MNTTVQLPPTPEYCLFWFWTDWWPLCMTKAEWSSWAQALFSVLAIAAAVGVAYVQHRQGLRQQRELEKAARARVLAAHIATAEAMMEELQNATSCLDAEDQTKREIAVAICDHVKSELTFFNSLKVEGFPSGEAVKAVREIALLVDAWASWLPTAVFDYEEPGLDYSASLDAQISTLRRSVG
ncbi:hypothetical protein [Variovorax arabinosiphilus]|uniref:hypothetical protein n=1 Tax=Variovorax arabinosiphilus TaxID=3053498 RepID=UPI00257638E9|nr:MULTISPECIES: hypothetical protein [unclassified Variovorax]MDM0118431.1 hypothetical protein [Variovorax sp. J2L1-78]MDM0128856.1 hypothetical protein [Variovorax sp. J2L1-63]MDM0233358.1 hypothetical protein [Variovorax sp. J2R1-6]